MIHKILFFMMCLCSKSMLAQNDSAANRNDTLVVFLDDRIAISKHRVNEQVLTDVAIDKNRLLCIDTSWVSGEAYHSSIYEYIRHKNKTDSLTDNPYIIRNENLLISTVNEGDNYSTVNVINTKKLLVTTKVSTRNQFVTGNYIITFRMDMDDRADGEHFNLIISCFSLANHKDKNKVVKVKEPNAINIYNFDGEYAHDKECAKRILKILGGKIKAG